MKFSFNWLKEIVAIDCSPADLATALTSVGIEVAAFAERAIPAGVVVGKVDTCEKHPNADKLSFCRVDVGSGTPLPVVCGAPNVKAGMLVACARVGTTFSPEMTIKRAKIRGVESEGMLCSERELGISDDHSGIMSLPPECAVGRPLKEYFPDDAIIEIELTPNRGDCLSLLGVAREVSAKCKVPLNPIARRPAESGKSVHEAITVTIDHPTQCPRYMGRLVRGVTIAESPLWMKQRLRACGIRPINNVVDVTNYILMLFGQPMHAFDFRTLRGGAIIVRAVEAGQTFMTLDNVERPLTAGDLLIRDAERPVALAGIMGGAGSEIMPDTVDVFLECAFFNPVGIRKTAKRIELSSDSSYRFERGVDYGIGLADALDTAAALIAELAGGEVAKGVIDAYPHPIEPKTIALRPAQASRLLGFTVSREMIGTILGRLGIGFVRAFNDKLFFSVPTHRHDLELEADLIEEVGRIYGYDNIPANVAADVTIDRKQNHVDKVLSVIRTALAYAGLHETQTNSMSSEKKLNLLTPNLPPVAIRNPLNPEMALLRTTLAGSLLEVTAYNLNRKNFNNRFFEIGKTFAANPGAELPRERDVVAILIEGNHLPATWNAPATPVSFWVLKGFLETLAAQLGADGFSYAPLTTAPAYLDAESAAVNWNGTISGTLGKVKPAILQAFEVKSAVCYAELDITDLLAQSLPTPSYRALPRFPAMERDFCFVMDQATLSAAVSDEIAAVSDLVATIAPFDLYQGEKLGAGLKSIAYSIQLRAPDRTLTDKEAEEVSRTIVARVKEKFNAVLRS
jgi:phenylalanyl-tRNA synthetase beta chain